MTPSQLIQHGNQYPFDAPNKWWATPGDASENPPPPPADWAHSAARGVIESLKDRGFEGSFCGIKEDVRVEMVAELAEVIRSANAQKDTAPISQPSSAAMAETIYGKGIEKALSTLRQSVYREIGNLLQAQAKGAIVPPEIIVSNVRIPLNPSL